MLEFLVPPLHYHNPHVWPAFHVSLLRHDPFLLSANVRALRAPGALFLSSQPRPVPRLPFLLSLPLLAEADQG